MIHYTCTACHGTAEAPKMCETAGCTKNGQPLQMCTCEDGQHAIPAEASASAPAASAPSSDQGTM